MPSTYSHKFGSAKFLDFKFDSMIVDEQSWLDPWSVEYRRYTLRRISSTRWQMRHTAESAADESLFIESQAIPFFSDYYAARLSSLTEWCDMDPDLVSAIEMQYDRYLQECGLSSATHDG